MYHRACNNNARCICHCDDRDLVQLPSVEGMADIPEGVFPEKVKDLKTLDGMFHFTFLLFTSMTGGTYSESVEDTRASICMTYYDLNGPSDVNMQLDIEEKRKLIAKYIGVIWE